MSDKSLLNEKVESLAEHGWDVQKRAQAMHKRFDFSNYDTLRDFLDDLQDLSESEDYFPDLTFTRSHVNVAVKSRDEELANEDFVFALEVDSISSKYISNF